jgi:hypothetical protein
VGGHALTKRIPPSLKQRVPALRERDALRREVKGLREQVAALEALLDHERLFPAEWADRRVRDHFGSEVRRGPFAGMAYPDWALGTIDRLAPKLLGIYELELHDAVERLIARSPELVMNVGAADGYYAVGLARRLPEARIVACELDEQRLAALAGLAELNGVRDRIELVVGACDHDTLDNMLGASSAVVCDIDGGERDLLRPELAPSLGQAWLLVEVHDHIEPGTHDALRAAFADSHEIADIPGQPRDIGGFPELDFIPWVTRRLAIDEFRGREMGWLELTPKA